MKKLIQASAFLALAFVFGGVTANAQSVTKVEANIPFDFIVGDRAFSAGSYVLRVSGTPSGARSLEIRNRANDVVYRTFAFDNGDAAKGKSELVFERSNGQAALTRVVVDNIGLSVPYVDATKYIAEIRSAADKAARNE